MARRGEYEEDDYDLPKHPALKNFSPTAEKVNHIAKTTARGAGMGALIGGAGLAAIAAGVMTLGMAAIPFVGIPLAIGSGVSGITLAAVGGAAITGATWGAGIGGLWKMISGISGSEEAVEDKAEKLTADYDRREAYQERKIALETRREQQLIAMEKQKRALGISPGNVPYGRDSRDLQV